MDLRLVSLDALAVTISTFFGIGIRHMVDALWGPNAWPRVWIGSALLSTAYGLFITFVQARVAFEGTRLLMYTSFLVAYVCSSHRLPIATLKGESQQAYFQFIGGLLFTFPFVWLGVRCAQMLNP